MGRGRINSKFFEKEDEIPREKIVVILNMLCRACGKLNELPNFDTEADCFNCKNKIVEFIKIKG